MSDNEDESSQSLALYERVKSSGAAALAGLTPDQLNTAAGDSNEHTALHYAAKAGDAAAVALLAAAGADLECKACYSQFTPLRYAVDANSLSAAQALLQAGADVSAQDVDGATPLHVAYSEHMVCDDSAPTPVGDCPIADLLLKHKANPNLVEDCFSRTPLAMAMLYQCNANTVLKLVAAGTELSAAASAADEACHGAQAVAQIAALAACGVDFLASDNCQQILSEAEDKGEFERVKQQCEKAKDAVRAKFSQDVAEVMKSKSGKN